MTNDKHPSKFNLPAHTISAEELKRSMPKAKRVRTTTISPLVPPSPVLMAELKELLAKLHPDDPDPRFSWSRVLIVIHFETHAHPDGFALAFAWCSHGRAHNTLAVVRKFWKNIPPKPRNPLTIRTLRWMVDQKCSDSDE